MTTKYRILENVPGNPNPSFHIVRGPKLKGKKQSVRTVPMPYLEPIDSSKYTAEKLREIRATGKHR